MTEAQVNDCTILRGVAGSRMLGLNTPESDTDILGICIEPIGSAMGVGAPFEQWVDEKAQTQIYGLRKFVRLALKGNPSMLCLLWMNPESGLLIRDARGSQLQELAPNIVHRKATGAYLGYLQAQKQRLLGERSNRGHGPMRPSLIEQHGFDTKYAMHMLRLGIQGVELQQTGRLQLPMAEHDRTFLMSVRNGEVPLQACLTQAGEYEALLKDLYETGPLPLEPDTQAVEAWMVKMYLRNWSATRTLQDRAEDAARVQTGEPGRILK